MSTQSKLSHSKGGTDVPLLTDTIGANLERTVSRFGDREALVDVPSARRWTYSQFNAAVDQLALGLDKLGIEYGDRVGIWAPNCPEWTLVQYATAKLGAILVNINPAYRTHELAFVLNQSGCRMLVSARAFKTADYTEMVASVRDEVPPLEMIVYLDSPEWDALIESGSAADPARLRQIASGLSEHDPINLQYTSGTTGFPKGATLTHRNILNNGFFVGEICRYTEADRICIPVPFYHCFGMVMGNLGATAHGSCMVIPSPGFDPAATLAAIQQERCTSVYGVPTMFIAELTVPDFASYDLSSLRTGIMAGSPCPIEVMKRVVDEMGCSGVTICYGMTETSPVSTQSDIDDDLEVRVSTVGAVHPHTEIKIVDPESGAEVPRGQVGEFCTRGYSVMRGYWNEPELTAAAIDEQGWMHSGDLATMDDRGYVNIVGRIKDMVIRGGENIYPREIEEFLYTHPAVADVQVIGVPDQKYGEQLCAFVRLSQPAGATEDELRDYCRGRLANYKTPRFFLFVEEFPMTVTGKIQKFKLREAAIEQLGLTEAAAIKTA
ncbi:MAG: AMP-binding protein [Solirubrobacterales bacterium]|nr:AMP-binding protein [Solirubrobacterales bacterium]